ncbi:MAG: N-acetylmuramoyl-L-alanine amidase [Ruminococcaceae bacterium]|nr:N-acetylmuramoyl-L-alanine amidase [Oscillospiraceae bacterium]
MNMANILSPDRVYYITAGKKSLKINEKIIPDSARAKKNVASWCLKGDPMKPNKPLGGGKGAKGVVIHNTNDIVTAPNTDPAEQYTRATWPNCNMSGAVVHFYVYKNSVWQNLSLEERGWHAGDGSSRRDDLLKKGKIGGNLDCIAIECIGEDRESEESTAVLAAWLLKKLGLTVDNGLYTHNYFKPSKKCPEYILDHWDDFKSEVRELMGLPSEEPLDKQDYYPAAPYKGRSIVDGLKSVGERSDFAFRGRLARLNGIEDYKGLASQNSYLLNLLKKGKLKRLKLT